MIDRYTRPEMGHIFSLENKYAIWQEIEVLACEAQAELKKIAAKETKEFQLFPEYTEDLYNRIDEIAHADLDEALSIAEKLPRQDRIHEIKEGVKATLAEEFTDMDDAEKDKEIGNAFKELQRQIEKLEKNMREAARMMEYEYAAVLRDEIIRLRGEVNQVK